MQIATCADDFLGAVLRDWVHIDPAGDANDPPTPALRRWARETLQPHFGAAIDDMPSLDAARGTAHAAHGAQTNAPAIN
jgi:hypothetical protein